jgi:glycosyltransferase involved in cell wall biosynthesis
VSSNQEGRLDVIFLDHCAMLSGGEIALLRLLQALTSQTGENGGDGLQNSGPSTTTARDPALPPRITPRVLLGEDGPIEPRLREAGIPVSVMPMGRTAASLRRTQIRPGRQLARSAWESGRYVLELSRELRRIGPDLVVTNSLKSAIYGCAAGVLAGVPVIWHLRDRISSDYMPPPTVRFVRMLARFVPRGIIANSHATLATVPTRRWGGPLTTVIPDPFPLPPLSAHDGSGALVVGMVGRLSPWKGQHVFLRAFASAFPDGPERALLVGGALFGEDAYVSDLEQMVDDLGLSDRVTMTGHVADVDAYYRTIDILVHASIVPEPFGQVVIEGMAQGIPVIATAGGGPSEIISDGIDGMLVAADDSDALAVALASLAGDLNRRRRLGTNARRRVADYAPGIIARETRLAYSRVLAHRRIGGRANVVTEGAAAWVPDGRE